MYASVFFLTIAKGGRKTPPGEGYSTVARFEDGSEWSLVIGRRSSGQLPVGIWFKVDVRALSSHAPDDLLVPKRKFVLVEGEHAIGEGFILEVPVT